MACARAQQKEVKQVNHVEEKLANVILDASDKESETNQVIEPARELYHPKYLDTDKGKIIRVLYSEGFLSLNELESKSELSKDGFWGAFYGLLGDGELLSNQKGEFSLSNELKQEWKRYFDSTQESDDVSIISRPNNRQTRRRRSSPYFKGQLVKKDNSKARAHSSSRAKGGFVDEARTLTPLRW
jgi:hypothetical protein